MFEFLCCDTEGRLCSASLFRFEARAWLQELTSLSEANGVERNGVILSVVLLWTSKEQVVRLRQ